MEIEMNIALIGATGFVGSAILPELLNRGHQVTVLARNPAKVSPQEGLKIVTADVLDSAQVARAVKGHDAVISAYNPGWQEPALYDLFLKGSLAIREGVKQAGVKRLLIVGGAASLYVAPGVQVFDTPNFQEHVPAYVIPGARAARDELNRLRTETELDWTFLSPPANLFDGPRRGAYRLGEENLLMDGAQPAGISQRDLAIAIVDEIETSRHIRKRFTVAA
jgi:putative NADH-flavin reductase